MEMTVFWHCVWRGLVTVLRVARCPHLALPPLSKAWFWDTFSRYHAVGRILSFSSAKLQWYCVWCQSQELSAKALIHFEVACCAGTLENSFNVQMVCHDGPEHESSVRLGIKISLLHPWLCAVCHHMLPDALSCPVLTAAVSYRFITRSINKARTTLCRLEERKNRRAAIHSGW